MSGRPLTQTFFSKSNPKASEQPLDSSATNQSRSWSFIKRSWKTRMASWHHNETKTSLALISLGEPWVIP